ncbi:hypothetical protein BDA96_08G091600 [Sorghum bicolor]|uniref:Uncharacterized protein n=1 Tax=Sorghum bicolor TaxID=4558 RepID=A0A921QF92_SORBI|nr:hypothetical protein BDA96_08G091600 [Sorghum bicolor]
MRCADCHPAPSTSDTPLLPHLHSSACRWPRSMLCVSRKCQATVRAKSGIYEHAAASGTQLLGRCGGRAGDGAGCVGWRPVPLLPSSVPRCPRSHWLLQLTPSENMRIIMFFRKLLQV